ncbi:MAG: ketopantoate reductase family protein [Candidatus Latescibacterota bacterium]|nr:MAG: ketopantoate reductase family protein [Candidatus Latescibacterota bacterium]
MKTLVYGAGNIGSLYAALLKDSGQNVAILSRGRRLDRIRQHGIELENAVTRKKTSTPIDTVERLDPDEAYDLVLVILPKHLISEVLPILAANRRTPNVMFMVNNAAGPGEMVDALGKDRVLLGFPGAAGVADDHIIQYLITSAREQPTTMGEVDGKTSPRIKAIAKIFQASGFPASICSNMDAWLKTHVAEILPTVGALYMVEGDLHRLACNRDALTLLVRAIREGYQVLRENRIPITPASHKLFGWLPIRMLLALMKRMIESDTTKTKVGHALEGRAEWRLLADEFRSLATTTDVPTPAMDRLYQHIDSTAGTTKGDK